MYHIRQILKRLSSHELNLDEAEGLLDRIIMEKDCPKNEELEVIVE